MNRPDDALILKAEKIFSQYGSIVTGQGLTRKELRQLERRDLIESQLMKNKDTGSLIYKWKPVSIAEAIIKKT